MQSQRSSLKLVLLAVLASAVLTRIRVANAQDAQQCPRSALTLPVQHNGQIVPLDLPKGEPVTVFFPVSIERFVDAPAGNVGLVRMGRQLTVQARPDIAPDTVTTVDVTAGSLSVRLTFRHVDKAQSSHKTEIYIEPGVPGTRNVKPSLRSRGGAQRALAKARPQSADGAAPATAAQPDEVTQSQRKPAGQPYEQQTSYRIDSNTPAWHEEWALEDLVPRTVTRFGEALQVDILRGRWRGFDLWLWVEVKNQSLRPYVVREPELSLANRRVKQPLGVRWSPAEFGLEGSAAVIPAGERARLRIIVPKDAMSGRKITPLQLSLVGDDDEPSGAQVEEWDMIPIGPDEYDDWKQEREERRRDRAARGRVSIFALGNAGIIWLANPFDEKDLDATILWGFGVGARYEFNRYLAVEGDIALAWSNEARFDDVMQGELTRAASLGRGSAGFALQLGHEIIPTLRGGVGLQGVSHAAELAMTPGEGPALDFELDAVWYFGAGVDWLVAEGFKLGAKATVITQASAMAGSGTRGAVLFGVHASFSWKP